MSDLELEFRRIDDYAAKLGGGERPVGATYWSRYYLESARFVLTGRDGIDTGQACTPADRESRDAGRLRKDFAAREKLVRELEARRGVRFYKVLKTGPAWSWANAKDDKLIDLTTASTL